MACCGKSSCCQVWFGLFLIFASSFISYQWLFARDILEMGNIKYNYDYNYFLNDTQIITTTENDINDTLVKYFCNRNYIIIDDNNYKSDESLGFYIWNNGENEYISLKKGVSKIPGIYIERKEYVTNKQKTHFNLYFWITLVGLNIFGLILFIRALAIFKKDKYLKRYLIELIIVAVVSIILLSISISMVTKPSYSCKSTLTEILNAKLTKTPIIFLSDNLDTSIGETILILYGIIIVDIIFILGLIMLILRLKCTQQNVSFNEDDDEDNDEINDGNPYNQYKTSASLNEGIVSDGDQTTAANPNLEMFNTTLPTVTVATV